MKRDRVAPMNGPGVLARAPDGPIPAAEVALHGQTTEDLAGRIHNRGVETLAVLFPDNAHDGSFAITPCGIASLWLAIRQCSMRIIPMLNGTRETSMDRPGRDVHIPQKRRKERSTYPNGPD
jgi:hypothetical protein